MTRDAGDRENQGKERQSEREKGKRMVFPGQSHSW